MGQHTVSSLVLNLRMGDEILEIQASATRRFRGIRRPARHNLCRLQQVKL